jgi:hypothetical protein
MTQQYMKSMLFLACLMYLRVSEIDNCQLLKLTHVLRFIPRSIILLRYHESRKNKNFAKFQSGAIVFLWHRSSDFRKFIFI